MQFTKLLALLSLAPLILAAPVANPQGPSVIIPSGNPAKSIVIDRINRFLGGFSTRPNILSVPNNPTPVLENNGTTVDGGVVLKPVETPVEGEETTETEEGNFLKLKPVKEAGEVTEGEATVVGVPVTTTPITTTTDSVAV
ncbi:hypothetical protein BJ508DRAFT_375308 [Ascobolus immersus RN42]|uniref:Uncharacterized protein n=1 Tax=Ascobolus immersus RN42 TaxID=1160509 RepID=A0A3N4IC73_ASCIM|nr:hypothetical protein BJ508DRAFT_375308 [Ascobolus immersus RN42]